MCELVRILNFDDLVIKCWFDDGKIIIYIILWIEWYVLMLIVEWWI